MTRRKRKSPYTLEQRKQFVNETANNPYTADISRDCQRIYYSGQFYMKMNDLLGKGKSPVEAYAECGYDVEKLGEDRAYKAAKQARNFVKNNKQYDPRSYTGENKVEILEGEDPRVTIAKLQARIASLETMQEVQKKMFPELEEEPSNLTPNETK
jgi:hypothetical protein